MNQQRMASVYADSLRDPERCWRAAAEGIDWIIPPSERVLDESNPPFYRWFGGARLNTCHNAVDRHVDNGRGDQRALVWDSPVTGSQRTSTYRELRDEVARTAGLLQRLRVVAGDTVV